MVMLVQLAGLLGVGIRRVTVVDVLFQQRAKYCVFSGVRQSFSNSTDMN